MTSYYFCTDALATTIDASSADEAVREFASQENLPATIRTVADLEAHLEKVGGHGSLENEDTGEMLFDIQS